MFAVHAALR